MSEPSEDPRDDMPRDRETPPWLQATADEQREAPVK